MILVLMAILVLAFGNGVWGGLVCLSIGAYMFLSSLGREFSMAQYMLFFGFVWAVPLAAFGATLCVEKFCFEDLKLPSMRTFGLLFGCFLMTQSSQLFSFFEEALKLTIKFSGNDAFLLALKLGSSVVFCGAIVAIVSILIHLIFEFPFHWLFSANGLGVTSGLSAFRPLTVVAFVCIAFQLICELFVWELRIHP